MDKAITAIGILAFAIVATGFVIVPVAFIVAIFTYVTGIAIAPWIATAIAFPVSLYLSRNIVNL